MNQRLPLLVLIIIALCLATGAVLAADTLPDIPTAPAYAQHVVVEGDTFWNIARDAGIDVETLLRINQLPNANRLDIGQVLNVPQPGQSVALPANVASEPVARAITVAVDTTGSMIGTPFEQQLQAVRELVAGLGRDVPLTLVTYSNTATVVFGPSTDRAALALSLSRLATGGDAALYDGALLATTQAIAANAENPLVVLFTDGGNMNGLSNASREETIRNAWANAIPVVSIAIGPQADLDYLRDLSDATGGKLYSVDTTAGLSDTVNAILTDITANAFGSVDAASDATIPSVERAAAARAITDEVRASLLSPTLAGISLSDTFVQFMDNRADAPLLAVPGINPGSAQVERGANPIGLNRIPPLLDGLNQLNLTRAADAIGLPLTTADAAPDAGASAALVSTSGVDTENIATSLTSNIAPIAIEVASETDVQIAELALNGYRLQTFEQPPYTYELDTTLLDEGHYNLSFTVANQSGVMSAGTFEFEVAFEAAEVTAPSVRDATAAVEAGGMALAAVAQRDTSNAMRVLMVGGKPVDLNLTFSTEGGLLLIVPSLQAMIEPQESLFDILAQPANNLIPPAVRQALTTPRPIASSLIILTMTLTLLPQGLFTLYWLMYSWNNPKTIEESQSPREFVGPEISFTALLPARHEEAVIKDTIYAVDRINYPDHLKEVLILCRDDDQGTIAKAREAVAELGKPNVRVVTFSTGPINKPHSLNIGLGEATNEVVAVFDAEDEPHPDIYNVINTVMLRDDADVVQSGVQLMNFKSSWFSALNVLEYFFWFKSGLHCFTRQFQVTPLGGNTVFFKKHYLEQIDGWDENCLTEDADVGIRLTLLGAKIQIVYDAIHATREETPDTVESFIKQRTRWNQGFYQVFFKGDWLKLPTMKQRITALYILLNSLMQAAILLFLPVGLFIALTQQVAVPIALISYIPIYLLLMQLLTNLIGIREFADAYGEKLPFGFRLRMIVAYYPYQLLLAVAAGRAILRQLSQKQTWEKTAHSNLHRQNQVLGRA